jgi:hypothetical protein
MGRERRNGLLVYLSDAESDKLTALSMKTGLSRAVMIRKLIMGLEPSARVPDEWQTVYTELHRIGTNVNQIARKANRTGDIHAKEYTAVYKEFLAQLDLIKQRVYGE